MSSVMYQIDCPQCQAQADAIKDLRSYEQWIQCGSCGYHFELKLHLAQSEEAPLRYKRIEKAGFGAARYQGQEDIGYCRFSLRKNGQGRYLNWVIANASSLKFAALTIQQPDGHWHEVFLIGRAPDQDGTRNPESAVPVRTELGELPW